MKNDTNIQRQTCEKFGEPTYSSYVQQQMSVLDANDFETHALTCSCCLLGIRKATILHRLKKEKTEDELLKNRTLALMDRLDRSVFSIVIRAVQGMVELIKSTGELMVMTPVMAGARSSSEKAGSDVLKPLRLVKEFEESKLSVEVTISPIEPDMLDLIVSLLDRQHEEFIPGVSVSCRGENEIFDETTDNNGQASFKVPSAGFYELVMKKDDHLLGTMTLTGL